MKKIKYRRMPEFKTISACIGKLPQRGMIPQPYPADRIIVLFLETMGR